MSFTTDIKSELCHIPVTDDTAMAECLGMLLFAGQFSREGLRLQSEMQAVRRRAQFFLNQCMDVWPEENDTILQLWDSGEIARIFAYYGYERESSLPLNRALVALGLLEELPEKPVTLAIQEVAEGKFDANELAAGVRE